jgi:hypothetical protein
MKGEEIVSGVFGLAVALFGMFLLATVVMFVFKVFFAIVGWVWS